MKYTYNPVMWEAVSIRYKSGQLSYVGYTKHAKKYFNPLENVYVHVNRNYIRFSKSIVEHIADIEKCHAVLVRIGTMAGKLSFMAFDFVTEPGAKTRAFPLKNDSSRAFYVTAVPLIRNYIAEIYEGTLKYKAYLVGHRSVAIAVGQPIQDSRKL